MVSKMGATDRMEANVTHKRLLEQKLKQEDGNAMDGNG